MNLIRTLRVGAGVVLALLTTAVMALGVIAIGIPYKIGVDWWASWRNPLELAPRLWAWIMYEGIYASCFDVRSVTNNEMQFSRDKKLTVCMANHPATAALAPLVRYITKGSTARLVFVAKIEHSWNVFVGVPLWLINGVIFVDRSDRPAAFGAIRNGLQQRFRLPTVLVIFPDQHRPTQNRIAADRERFGDRIPGLRGWLHWTPLPRGGGLAEVLNHIHHPVLFLDLTAALGACRLGIADTGRLFGKKFRLVADVLASTDAPRSREDLKVWLTARWRSKNELLARWAASA